MTSIRGVHLFAPYRKLGWRAARSPSSGEPGHPLLRDDPDHIWQVAAAFPPALLDSQQPEPSRFPNGVLNHPATDPGPGRDLVHASITEAVLAHLVPND